jgi:hypothetical protein
VGLEHNLLFNATTRYTVSTTGPALSLTTLFDGAMNPSYTTVAPTVSAPTVILIENLPDYHTQAGAWVGWSTRFWPSSRFKVEGFDVYYTNSWKTLADYSTTDYNGYDFKVELAPGAYTKLKFTFYVGSGDNGRFGVSELFFIHPEAMYPYQGLLASSHNNWDNNGNNLYYNSTGNVGIGTTAPDEKLTVKGKIHTQEVRVDMAGPLVPDYVFAPDYDLKPLSEVAQYIKENRIYLKFLPQKK